MPKLSECKHISSEEYMNLKNPKFIGQTRLDSNNQYWMIFSCENIFYKIQHIV